MKKSREELETEVSRLHAVVEELRAASLALEEELDALRNDGVERRPGAQPAASEAAAGSPAPDRIFLQSILDSSTNYAIITLDLAGRVMTWNEGARQILGWTAEEMAGRPISVIFTAWQQEAGIPERELKRALRDGHARDERWHLRKDGRRFWSAGMVTPLRTDRGTLLGYLKILRDRTEQRRAQEALQSSRERLELALNAARTIGVWDWDVPKDLMQTDDRVARLYSVDSERAAAGVPIAEFYHAVHPDDRTRIQRAMEEGLATAGDFNQDYRLIEADGQIRWVQARGRCYHDEQGQPVRFSGILIDITDQKRTEEELRSTATSLRLAIDAAQLGRWDYSPADRSISFDDGCRMVFGLPPSAEISFERFVEQVHPEDRQKVIESRADLPEGDGTGRLHFEFRMRRFDTGEERWIDNRGQSACRDGVCEGFVGILQDITDRKKGELHLRLLVDELNHRVKNTLATVQAIAGQTFRFAGNVEEALPAFSARLFALARVHDTLSKVKWEKADLRALVEQMLAPHLGIDSERIIATGPRVELRPNTAVALALALHELVTNAIKYGALSNDRGYLHIDWELTGDDQKRLYFIWRERGGPEVQPPARRGFGSRLLERGLPDQLQGSVQLIYDPAGLVCIIEGAI